MSTATPRNCANELTEALVAMVAQHCESGGDYELDSFAVSANADALRLLERLGRVQIELDIGRRVCGRWIDQA